MASRKRNVRVSGGQAYGEAIRNGLIHSPFPVRNAVPNEPATWKQMYYLACLGWAASRPLTKSLASEVIAELKWRSQEARRNG